MKSHSLVFSSIFRPGRPQQGSVGRVQVGCSQHTEEGCLSPPPLWEIHASRGGGWLVVTGSGGIRTAGSACCFTQASGGFFLSMLPGFWKSLQNGGSEVPPPFAVLDLHRHPACSPCCTCRSPGPYVLGCNAVWAASCGQAGQGLPELCWAPTADQPGKTWGHRAAPLEDLSVWKISLKRLFSTSEEYESRTG